MRFQPEIKYDLDDLGKTISRGEGVQLDFKQTINSSKKIARTIAAFANNSGGKLLIGVMDNGNLLGCNAEEEMYMLYEAAQHFCDPPIEIIFSIFETIDDLSILEVQIKNSLLKPHFAIDENDEWQLYMRSNDKTLLASKSTKKMLEQEEFTEIGKLDSKEQFALDFLKKNDFLLPKEFARRMNISLQRMNTILIKLTKAGLILYDKDTRGEYYVLR